MHRAWPGLDFGALCGAHSDELELKMAATPGSHPGGPGSADAARPLPGGADTRIIPPDGGGWACGDFCGAERFVWSDVAGGEVGVGEGPARPGSPAADSPERPRQVWGAGRGVNWGVTDGLEAEPAPDLRGNEVQPGRRGASVADPGGLARRRRAQELPDGKLNLDEAAKLRALRNQMEEYEVKIKDFTKEYTSLPPQAHERRAKLRKDREQIIKEATQIKHDYEILRESRALLEQHHDSAGHEHQVSLKGVELCRMVSAMKKSQAHRDHLLASKKTYMQPRENYTISSFHDVVDRKREVIREADKEAERLRNMEQDVAFQYVMTRESDTQTLKKAGYDLEHGFSLAHRCNALPADILQVTIVRGNNLPAKDAGGTSDPTVYIFFRGLKKSTSTKHQTLTPLWNETFEFKDFKMAERSSPSAEAVSITGCRDIVEENLRIECFDRDLADDGSPVDEKMGGFEINLKKDLKQVYWGTSSSRSPTNMQSTPTGNNVGFSGSRRPYDEYHFKGWRSFEQVKGELLVEVVLIRETG
eukprot:Tamp_13089.p1 GENE.Tamp_13089~~Tamp_13089.p1  ORF type:complete len:552 (+),score=90.54 Tamp_13089:61-1656(+)